MLTSNFPTSNLQTLVTTMGGQAQVVTFALDWLLAQGEAFHEVMVLHLSPDDPRVRKALDQLAAEFPGDRYAHANRPMRLRRLPICDGSDPLCDIRDETAAEATWQTVYRVIAELKGQGRALHVCLAGGRRVMGLMAMSAAMLHFDHRDKLWHLYTPDELRRRAFEGAVMHVGPEEGVRLIQVPIAPWGVYFPALRAMLGAPSARVLTAHTQWVEDDGHARCRRVVERLTERQQAVLQLFAAGRTPQEVAEALNISLKTVDTHKTIILAECRNEWPSPPPGGRLDYHFLRVKFGPYFQ
jgi:CRISPR-associated protein Csx14